MMEESNNLLSDLSSIEEPVPSETIPLNDIKDGRELSEPSNYDKPKENVEEQASVDTIHDDNITELNREEAVGEAVQVAINQDDVESLKKEMENADLNLPVLNKWTIEAVRCNSRKCLECLCEVFENKLPNDADGERLLRTVLRESPLHYIARSDSSIRLMEIIEKYPIFIKTFLDAADKHGFTPLLIALKKNNIDVAKRLVNNDIKRPNYHKKNMGLYDSPINVAALKGQTEVLQDMLGKCSSGYNRFEILTDGAYGWEHSILYPASFSKNPDILDFLMKEEKASELLAIERNHPDWYTFVGNICESGHDGLLTKIIALDMEEDSDGVTVLMRATIAGSLEAVKMILEKGNGKETIPLCDKTELRNVLHYAVKHPRILDYLLNTFKMLPKYNIGEQELFSSPFVGYTSMNILKAALEDWEERSPHDVLDFIQGDGFFHPLCRAAERDIEMVLFFVDKGTNVKQRDRRYLTALHCAVIAGKLDIVNMLVGISPEMINWMDDHGRTAAGMAIKREKLDILIFLINNGAVLSKEDRNYFLGDLELYHIYCDQKTAVVMEVIKMYIDQDDPELEKLLEGTEFSADELTKKLVVLYPNAAIMLFDRHLFSIGNIKVFRFQPFYRTSKDGKLESIEAMVKNKRDECLAHPLVDRFMDKILYSGMARLWFAFDISMYILFLVTLSTYAVLTTKDPYNSKSSGPVGLSIIVIVAAILNIVKEILQMFISRMDYIFQYDNYMEWVMYICAIVFVVEVGDTKSNAQISAGAVSLFFAWLNFIWYLKWLSLFGIYIIMAKKVFMSVCKVLPMVLLFITAFAMAFNMLMSSDNGFDTILTSFVTTFVMMTGEIDFRDTFLDDKSSNFHVLQIVILVLFLLVVCISIMNLLTGLAVGDTNEMMKRSKEERQLEKARLVLHVFRMVSILPDKNPDSPLEFGSINEEDREDLSWWLALIRWWNVVVEDDEVIEQAARHVEKTIRKAIRLKFLKDHELRVSEANKTMEGRLDSITKRCDAMAEKTNDMAEKTNDMVEKTEALSNISEANEKKLCRIETVLESVLSALDEIKKSRK